MARLLTTYFLLLSLVGFHHASAEADWEFEKEPVRRPWLLPDLSVTEISSPFSVGSNFQVRVVVRNLARIWSPASNFLFLDNNSGYTQQKVVPRLGAGQATSLTFSVSPPENQGPWYFTAIVDYGNAIREINETNNVKKLFEY